MIVLSVGLIKSKQGKRLLATASRLKQSCLKSTFDMGIDSALVGDASSRSRINVVTEDFLALA